MRPPLMTEAPIASVPTTYGGVRFRSRLEARWAAFYDLLGWRWDYEPLDLAHTRLTRRDVKPGNMPLGHTPDFCVRRATTLGTAILVEVKASLDLTCDRLTRARERLDDAWPGRALVVGAVPFREHDRYSPVEPGAFALGWWRDPVPEASSTWWKPCCLTRVTTNGGMHVWQLSDDPSPLSTEASLDAVMRWHEAGNRTQWRAPAR